MTRKGSQVQVLHGPQNFLDNMRLIGQCVSGLTPIVST